jgi:hypothetical protein
MVRSSTAPGGFCAMSEIQIGADQHNISVLS